MDLVEKSSAQENKIFEAAEEYREYFKDDDAALTELLDRLKRLQQISDTQIDEISNAAPGRGTQHYLIEHITNAISIQNQMQSVLKDKRSIKETALNIAMKTSNDSESIDAGSIALELQKVVKDLKKQTQSVEKLEKTKIVEKTDEELDKEIEEELKRQGSL